MLIECSNQFPGLGVTSHDRHDRRRLFPLSRISRGDRGAAGHCHARVPHAWAEPGARVVPVERLPRPGVPVPVSSARFLEQRSAPEVHHAVLPQTACCRRSRVCRPTACRRRFRASRPQVFRLMVFRPTACRRRSRSAPEVHHAVLPWTACFRQSRFCRPMACFRRFRASRSQVCRLTAFRRRSQSARGGHHAVLPGPSCRRPSLAWRSQVCPQVCRRRSQVCRLPVCPTGRWAY